MKIPARFRQHKPVLKKQYGEAKIGIFGSIARGEERPDCNIDVLIAFRKGEKAFDNFKGMKLSLAGLFDRSADLVTDTAVKFLLRRPILQEGVYV